MIKLSIHTILQYKIVPDFYSTQEMCDKAVNRCFLGFAYIPD